MAISDDDISDLAKAPERMQTDEGSVKERSVDELIKAKNYNETSEVPPYGIRYARMKPPSAFG